MHNRPGQWTPGFTWIVGWLVLFCLVALCESHVGHTAFVFNGWLKGFLQASELAQFRPILLSVTAGPYCRNLTLLFGAPQWTSLQPQTGPNSDLHAFGGNGDSNGYNCLQARTALGSRVDQLPFPVLEVTAPPELSPDARHILLREFLFRIWSKTTGSGNASIYLF